VPKGQEIVSFGSGWYRCTMDVKTGQGVFSGMNFAIELDNGAGTGAMSNSYAGDGTSGAYFWRSTCLPPAAWDLHTVTFFDDFTTLNTIDIHDTKAPGFNWYVDPNWPNYLTGLDVTGPTNYSINSSVLTTDATALAAGHYVLPISAVYTSGGNWNGFVFTPSVLLEASQATQQVRPGQMSFWTHSLAFLLSANPPNGWHIENDFYEYPPGGGLLPRITFAASPDNVENTLSSAPNYEAWQPTEAYTTTVFVSYLGVLYQANTNPTVGVPPPTAEWTTVSPQPPSHTEVDYTQQNITQTLWLAAGNGDVGQVLSFFNNSFIPTIHFIYGRQIFNVPGPGVPSPLPIYFFIGDGLPGPVILQTNGGFKTFWGFVRVTQ
jgi:hypothetical protein